MSSISTWAKLIKCHEEVPVNYKEYFQSLKDNQINFPYTIYMPQDRWGRRATDEKLLYIDENTIYLFENMEGKIIKAICYPFDKITHIEKGKVLLYSWMKIYGEIEDQYCKSMVEYNSVVENLFNRVLEEIRTDYLSTDGVTHIKEELNDLAYLRDLDYKFYYYANDYIRSGQRIVCTIYQQEIRAKVFKIFSKRITTVHLTILTDKELILIEEGPTIKSSMGKYCGVWTFSSIDKINDISVKETDNSDIVCLKICYFDNDSKELYFATARCDDLDTLIRAFNNLKM